MKFNTLFKTECLEGLVVNVLVCRYSLGVSRFEGDKHMLVSFDDTVSSERNGKSGFFAPNSKGVITNLGGGV